MSRFDYTDGDFLYDIGGNMMMDTEGDLMQDLGCGMAMDMDSGEMHFVDNSFDDFDNSNYSYNNDENDW